MAEKVAKKPAKKSKTTSFRFTEEEHEMVLKRINKVNYDLKAIKEHKPVDISQIMRFALTEYLNSLTEDDFLDDEIV